MKLLIHAFFTFLLSVLFLSIISNDLDGQSNWSHGVGIGLALTDFIKDPENIIDNEKYRFDQLAHRSFHVWNKYDVTDKIQFSISPGFNWRGARFIREGFNYDGIYFATPILLEYNLFGRFFFGTGIEYGYLISFGESSDDEIYNLTSQVDTRHLFSYVANVRYTLGQHTSLNLAYNHGINAFYQLSRFNTAGGTTDRVNLRNKGIQITFIFHT